MEHIACLYENVELCEDIRPKFDVKDYSGNLPLHYTIMRDDVGMVRKYFMKSKHFFDAKNFRNETIFHIAAKHDSRSSLRELLGNNVFVEDLLRRNYKGDTPLHVAAKSGNLEVLQFFLENCTSRFLDIENDFGLTPLQSATSKRELVDSKPSSNKQADKDNSDFEKQEKLDRVSQFLSQFQDFLTVEGWSQKYDLSYQAYIDKQMDPALALFLDIDGSLDDVLDAGGKY